MESRYDPAEAQRYIDRYGSAASAASAASAYSNDLALRVYTSHLLGAEPSLVLHGGGNTSVKTTQVDLLGDEIPVICVKGSGWDLATIEPRGFPACRLDPLRRGAERAQMTDEQMVALLRSQMLDPSGPTPSVEALLHAYLPARFVDHTHADAVLAAMDQEDSATIAHAIWGDAVLLVPYVMPGFVLARRVAELLRPRLDAGRLPALMVLDKHGIFTWGDSAEESYTRMITAVTQAERYLASRGAPLVAVRAGGPAANAPSPTPSAASPQPSPPDASGSPSVTASVASGEDDLARIGAIVRGAFARASGKPWVCAFRTTPDLLAFTGRADLHEASQIGCATPDHVIRTKAKPLVLDVTRAALVAPPAELRAQVEAGLAAYATSYRGYFERACAARGVTKQALDPLPRVVLLPGHGLLSLAASRAEAEIAADIYEHTAAVITSAQALGSYRPVSDLDLFDVEYWSLEQAKLKVGAKAEGPLSRRIALVTGAASGIGLSTAQAFLDAGAHVAMTDLDPRALAGAAAPLATKHGARVLQIPCDVLDEASVREAFTRTAAHFGGVDVVVSNAGRAFTGGLHTQAGDDALSASLELNLRGHQRVARAAAALFLLQGTGGALLFNASKSAFNPGPDFGPYAVAKAGVLALMRQYAIDLAPAGVRASAVNADRIRTGIFEAGLLEARAKARGVTVDDYFRANLLGRETTGADVAQAFLYLATAQATTGCVITVDGGNAAAFPR
ncbi:bifunctional aldolase/short-chain dehydrogenase [Chondromyces apiculatus]|uniref:Putative oxidoreductase n=1 Tax=Chondromyces apiculatus DSM 436 TaxID=1192034 RepID=A0A017T9F2_9BACT|nr:bifunctional aldolase/short-chain dehydrogenase [Chondromyces apiculatus]EYF05445.1 Putative oxidoreductase [Chondromyces apiculatus DSM 436]